MGEAGGNIRLAISFATAGTSRRSDYTGLDFYAKPPIKATLPESFDVLGSRGERPQEPRLALTRR